MPLTVEQIGALHQARQILEDAGLLQPDNENTDGFSPSQLHRLLKSHVLSTPHPDIQRLHYIAPAARTFTSDELCSVANRLTRKSYVNAIVEHPQGVIVEYPETGSRQNEAVAHIFPVDPTSFVDPKDNLQYSLGDPQGYRANVKCYILRDSENQEPVCCLQVKKACRGVKHCSFGSMLSTTTSGNRDLYPYTPPTPSSFDARREVFVKTLAFFCALVEQGCPFRGAVTSTVDVECEDSDDDDDIDGYPGPDYASQDHDLYEILRDIRARVPASSHCEGRLVFRHGLYGRAFIQCEHHARGRRAHLLLRNLNEYDMAYLQALIENNTLEIEAHEKRALNAGYGPLAPCQFVAAPREQKTLCPNWHRGTNGKLMRGIMHGTDDCPVRFEVYYPYDLTHCSKVLLVARNAHSHVDPTPSKTPQAIVNIFNELLKGLDWKLADATPRRILLDSAFITGLRHHLAWDGFCDPTLPDLHPSLGNSDHTARLINNLRSEHFPHGTGLGGAYHLLAEHKKLKPEEAYVRCVEEHDIPGEGKFRIVICMFKAMSELLIKTRRPSIDTSFKRLHQWQEFEIEAWYEEYHRSIVVARAFTTSQSASAHHILFQRIFAIVESDTGRAVHFRHIHGDGFDTVMADGHKGQALGLGRLCTEICHNMVGYCAVEHKRALHTLNPYEHLARFYRYCFEHFTRNIAAMRTQISPKVRQAMMSLASAEPLDDFDGILQVIRNGGKKAAGKNWLKDKEISSPFAIPALYRPASKIPIDVWKASPSTSNGNEQSHRNVNRDGVKLTMTAGIMRGMQYDARAMRGIEVLQTHGIHSRDQRATHYRRAARTIIRSSAIQKQTADSYDLKIRNAYKQVVDLQNDVLNKAKAVKRTFDSGRVADQACKRLRTADKKLHERHTDLTRLQVYGSGTVLMPELKDPDSLYDHRLLSDAYGRSTSNANLPTSLYNPTLPLRNTAILGPNEPRSLAPFHEAFASRPLVVPPHCPPILAAPRSYQMIHNGAFSNSEMGLNSPGIALPLLPPPHHSPYNSYLGSNPYCDPTFGAVLPPRHSSYPIGQMNSMPLTNSHLGPQSHPIPNPNHLTTQQSNPPEPFSTSVPSQRIPIASPSSDSPGGPASTPGSRPFDASLRQSTW